MTDLRDARSATEGAEPALREHQPAASVVSACLAAQAGKPRRSIVSRVFGASPLNDESRKWYLGAITELHVAGELAKLGRDWVVLHSVPVGERAETIEHLAIGPAGVFAIGFVRAHDGSIDVRGEQLILNGSARADMLISRDAATDAAVRLTRATGFNVPVRGLLVALGAQSLTVRDEPDDIGITSGRGLYRRLISAPVQLDREQVAAIAAVASERATWHSEALRRHVAVFDADAFADLRIQVQRAWAARGFWGCAAAAVAAIVAGQFIGV